MEVKVLTENQAEEIIKKTNLIAYCEGFRRFCRQQYDAEPFIAGFFEGGKLEAVLPVFKRRTGGSNIMEAPPPFYYTEPIFIDPDYCLEPDRAARELLKFFNADAVGMNFYEMSAGGRMDFNGFDDKFTAYIFDTKGESNPEKLLAEEIGKKTRNQIRAGQKNNLVVDVPDLDSFYGLYGKHRARLGVGVRSKKYFQNLTSSFGDQAHVLGVRYDGELVGANLFITNNDYLWLVNSVFDPRFAHLYPSNFVYWEMIKWGIAHGIRYFDYGGGLPGNVGLSHFKEGMGGKPHRLYSRVFYKNALSRFKYWLEQKVRHVKLRFL